MLLTSLWKRNCCSFIEGQPKEIILSKDAQLNKTEMEIDPKPIFKSQN